MDEKMKKQQLNKRHTRRRFWLCVLISALISLLFCGVMITYVEGKSEPVTAVTIKEDGDKDKSVEKYAALSDEVFDKIKKHIAGLGKQNIEEGDIAGFEKIIFGVTEKHFGELTDEEKAVLSDNIRQVLLPYTDGKSNLMKDGSTVARKLATETSSIVTSLDEIRNVYAKLSSNDKEKEELLAKLTALEQTVAALEERLSKAEADGATQSSELQTVLEKELQSNYQTLLSKYDALNGDFDKYKKEQSQLFTELDGNIKNVSATLSANHQAMDASLKNLHGQMNQKDAQLTESIQKQGDTLSGRMEAQNSSLQNQMKEQKENLQQSMDTKSQALEEEIKKLKEDINTKIGDLKSIEVSEYITAAGNPGESIAEQIQAINDAISSLHADDLSNLSEVTDKINALEGYVKENDADIRAQITADEKVAEDAFLALDTQMAEVKDTLQKLGEEDEQIKALIEKNKSEAKEAIDDLNKQLGNTPVEGGENPGGDAGSSESSGATGDSGSSGSTSGDSSGSTSGGSSGSTSGGSSGSASGEGGGGSDAAEGLVNHNYENSYQVDVQNVTQALHEIGGRISAIDARLTVLENKVQALEGQLGGYSIRYMTQAQYDALPAKDPKTIYFLTN